MKEILDVLPVFGVCLHFYYCNLYQDAERVVNGHPLTSKGLSIEAPYGSWYAHLACLISSPESLQDRAQLKGSPVVRRYSGSCAEFRHQWQEAVVKMAWGCVVNTMRSNRTFWGGQRPESYPRSNRLIDSYRQSSGPCASVQWSFLKRFDFDDFSRAVSSGLFGGPLTEKEASFR